MNNNFLTHFSFYYFIKSNNMTFLTNYFVFLIYEKQYKKIKFDKKKRAFHQTHKSGGSKLINSQTMIIL